MSLSNKEMQLRKNCELYAFVLASQDKEIPDIVLECCESYDYLIDCSKQLAHELESLDTQSYQKLFENPDSQIKIDLSNWWQMYQEATELRKSLFSDVN